MNSEQAGVTFRVVVLMLLYVKLGVHGKGKNCRDFVIKNL